MTPEIVSGWLMRIIGSEGGYVDNPADPGGETRWGVSKRSYPDLDIKALTIDEAAAIYVRDYLAPLRAAELPPSVTFQLLDFAINSGVYRAVVCLQRAVGATEDGHMGPATVAAVARHAAADVVMLLLAARLEFMAGLSVWPQFGKGWARRIAQNLRYGAEDL